MPTYITYYPTVQKRKAAYMCVDGYDMLIWYDSSSGDFGGEGGLVVSKMYVCTVCM
jgi:hypothetical protein